MKALILNSGLGSRMGVLTSEQPKCMTEINAHDTILSRQLKLLAEAGIDEVVMTIGYYSSVLVNYCHSLDLPLHYTFVNNPLYDQTNYIYSIYCAREYLDDDIILMHGDLVFENEVFDMLLASDVSCMAVSSTLPLPEKDFKAQLADGFVMKVGVDIFTDAVEAQALYKLRKDDWKIWLGKIVEFCETDRRKVYAENALNELNGACNIHALDVKDLLCSEIDNPEDLAVVTSKLKEVESRTVYMCFATDIIHGGHIAIIKRAERLGRLIIGVLSDEAVMEYKRLPLVPLSERMKMFANIAGVYKVVEQKTLSYRDNIELLKPDIVVHGDDWRTGFQEPVREEVMKSLALYGGKLVEYPFAMDKKYEEIDARTRSDMALPDIRRSMMKRALLAKKSLDLGTNGDALWLDVSGSMADVLKSVQDALSSSVLPVAVRYDHDAADDEFAYTVSIMESLGVGMIVVKKDLVDVVNSNKASNDLLVGEELADGSCIVISDAPEGISKLRKTDNLIEVC